MRLSLSINPSHSPGVSLRTKQIDGYCCYCWLAGNMRLFLPEPPDRGLGRIDWLVCEHRGRCEGYDGSKRYGRRTSSNIQGWSSLGETVGKSIPSRRIKDKVASRPTFSFCFSTFVPVAALHEHLSWAILNQTIIATSLNHYHYLLRPLSSLRLQPKHW